MDSVSIGLWVTGFMLFFVIIGMRVAFAAAIAGFIGLVWIFSAKMGFERGVVVAMKMAGTIPHSKVSTLALSLIPTFILIGFLAYHAGLTRALFEAAKRWVGWLPGGMGVATVFSAAGFAAVSGASVATSAVFARIAIPEMLQLGYDKRFAAGVVAASGTLASLIPPSAILVIYAIIVEQDVGALLMAGFLPGMVSALIYGGLVVFLAKTKKDFGPPVTGYSWKQRFESLPGTLPIFFVVGIIVVCIYGGVGTPTEAGSLGAFVILCMALWKGMTGGELKSALLETAKLTVMIFTIIWGVLLYVRFLGFADLPSAFSDWITGLEQSPMITLILILLAYALLGMFMDAIGMLLLTLPVVYPAVIALNGGDAVTAAESAFGVSGVGCAIWFGIIVVKMAELCLITPPIGLNCFVVAGVRDECSVQDVFHGVTPFFVADFLTIALLIALPQIVLWLPGLMGFS
ncbi:TRAP transporter large permease [Solemya velum gill symbiont]|uniref:C4-dicarboxylate ABC transporter permease n=3 Tax=Solemya velum gill symbiont TaxID=2340 RepID=A0A1T2LTB8_SOVGS|nr:TRAP transporter large permease [Solemya velum gill symbiont]OOY34121.1 C4-dicarboxylate ABC transporter permease [Solemya velum gill symbiont]OOY36776.1 C4-dicarboxylate ABC transporter permease [Solemya velum gill symbiont]OOY46247.1 C4-dicarboxylate ABC transporter permease [Solemya velum gill symbiont]OOY49790.1 C4-dicarboxylate ABC transporter permease [Solemya velum gill symbiont]OOY50161.1 C4-dicarboxylate ABC transporter permease [Solemya velum gill symbiont]